MIRNLVLLILFIFSFQSIAQSNKQQKQIDSINSLIKLSKDSNFETEVRLSYARNAYVLSKETNLDSTILKAGVNLSNKYLDLDEANLYKNIGLKNLELATKLNDSLIIANLNYGLGYFYGEEAQKDSAFYYYYNAEKIYNALGKKQSEGEVLLNIADIQETTKDYTGSEATAIRAISLIEPLPQTKRNLDTLWALYNLLGIISERLEQRDQALEYYQKSLDVANKMEDPLFYEFNSRNNIAFTLREKGELNTALKMFQELLDDSRLKQTSPELFVIVMENDATTKFLNNYSDLDSIENQFKEAYRVADSIDDPTSRINVLGDWANFYYETNRYEDALKLNTKNYNLAKESDNNDVVLKSLKLMSQLEGGEKGKQYLDEYIQLNDSLIKNERAFRNKFARISFEVDKIEADNEQLSRQALILTIVAIALLFSLVFIYIIITQRAKNRKLEFIQKQQEANEEIYNLMLAQQDKIEEGRTHEKKRISEELHDGILGKLFGTRLSLDSLNLVQTEEAAKSRSQYIEQLKTIETEIRKISHDLNSDFVADSSFIDIIKALVKTQTTAYNINYKFTNDDSIDWEEIPNKTKIHIYRMLQETMQNIYKHANASLVKISFQLKNNVILCTIEDDGSGFNVNKARKGIGLKNIDSRIKDIGGKAEVYSKIDVGTIIKIFIPVE